MGLKLWMSGEAVHALVWDDGKGLGDRPPGRGIAAMQRRASGLGGEVVAEPRPEGGTRVRIHLPLVARAMLREPAPVQNLHT